MQELRAAQANAGAEASDIHAARMLFVVVWLACMLPCLARCLAGRRMPSA